MNLIIQEERIMKMTKTYKRLCGVLGLSLICGTGMVSATSGSKNVLATYRDIQITYNGATKVVTDVNGKVVEPFSINGTTYVPLRGVSQILGVNASWDGSTNTVALTGNTPNTAPSVDVTPYITKINDLNNQLNAAKAELNALKGSSSNGSGNLAELTEASLNEMANDLYSDYFDALNSSIDLSFDLTQKASRLQLDITYSTSTENSKYDAYVTQTKVKTFIQDVCEEIQAKYGAIAIQGNITYDKADLQKVGFSVTSAGKYSYEFAITEDDVEDYVDDITDGYISLGNLGRKSIDSIEGTIKTTKINFDIYLDASSTTLSSDDKTKDWNSIASTSLVKSQLKEIVDEIEYYSYGDYTIVGTIYTSDNREIASIDSEGDVSVSKF